jgi:hypothetical protein
LESWNGYSDYAVDRVKRGSSYLPNLCLAVFGGIQPSRLTAYINQAQDALADDGMLQRFQMLVYPDPVRWENVDRAPNLVSLYRAYGVFEALANMVPQHWGAGSNKFIKFPYFTFQAGAQATFDEWHTDLHRSRLPAEEDPLIAQWLAKLDNLFLGLALIFHLIDIADTQIPQPGETLADAAKIPSWAAWVGLDAARRAAGWLPGGTRPARLRDACAQGASGCSGVGGQGSGRQARGRVYVQGRDTSPLARADCPRGCPYRTGMA